MDRGELVQSSLQWWKQVEFIWVRLETLCAVSNWVKSVPNVCKEVSERWRRKCHTWFMGCFLQWDLGRENANVYQNPLWQHAVLSLCSCRTLHRHTAKPIKQFFEAENIKIMKWAAQSPDPNPTENLWKILGDKVMAKKPTTVPELLKRLEDRTKITPAVWETSDVLKQSFNARAYTLPNVLNAVTFRNVLQSRFMLVVTVLSGVGVLLKCLGYFVKHCSARMV